MSVQKFLLAVVPPLPSPSPPVEQMFDSRQFAAKSVNGAHEHNTALEKEKTTLDSGHLSSQFPKNSEMKSLKHYFLSPAVKEQKETSKEPLQSSQIVNENSAAKQEEKETAETSGKEKRKKLHEKRDSKSKLSVDTRCEPVNGKKIDGKIDQILKSEFDEIVEEKTKTPQNDSSVFTTKSNAFQLLMSQKKNVTPENDPEVKKKSLSLKDSKTSEPEIETVQQSKSNKKSLLLSKGKSKKHVRVSDDDIKDAASKNLDEEALKELSIVLEEEPARPQRASRQAKEKAKKSFLVSDEELEEDDCPTPRSKRSSRKKEEPAKKPAEKPSKPIQDKPVENFKKRKMVISSDDKQKSSPTETHTNKAKKFDEQQSPKKDTKELDDSCVVVMEVDEPEPPKELCTNGSTKKQKENPAESKEVDSEDDFVLFKKNKKRKMSHKEKTSPEKNTPVVNKKSIAGYFTSISKDEAIKRAAVVLESAKTQTIKADVHVEPAGDQKRRSMGPSGRLSSSKSPKGADSIEVLESIPLEIKDDDVELQEKSPMKTPLNKLMHRKKKLWEIRVKLLSPAKAASEASSIASCSDSDGLDSDSELEVLSHLEKQTRKSSDWGAGGKLAPIFLPKTKSASQTSPLAAATRKIFKSVPLPSIRTAPTEHIIGFADEDPEAPICAMCPSVGHIGEHLSENKLDEKTQNLLDLMAAEEEENFTTKAFDLGKIESVPPRTKVVKKRVLKKKLDCETWCEKFKPKLADAVAGNERSVNRLRAWLEGWTESKTGAAKTNEIESEDSMDDFIVSDEDDSNPGRRKKKRKKSTNTVLLVGPSGCGKTASVYAIAEELGFKVLEVNASSKRSGKKILAELREATQSHQVRSGALDQDSINNFFGKKGKGSHETQNAANGQCLSLILIEDVDIIFEDQDEGFTAALNSLAENSKRPLVLVSNDPNCSLVLSRQHRIHFPFEIVAVNKSVDIIEDICETEEKKVDRDVLKKLVVQNNGDLRSTLLSTQFLGLSGGLPKTIPSLLSFPVDLNEIFIRMQTKPLPFIIKETEIEQIEVVEDSKLNTTWGDDSDSDDTLFKNLPFKSKIVKKIRSKLHPHAQTTEPKPRDLDVEAVSVPIPELEKMFRLADSVATLDILRGTGGGQQRNNMLPGLSDQPSYESPPDLAGPQMVFCIANKILSHFNLTDHSIEHWESNRSWLQSHVAVDDGLNELLPICNQLDRRGVALDFLPALRELGKCEHSSSRSSRRSVLNCLQSLGMQPDPFVLEALPFVFSQK